MLAELRSCSDIYDLSELLDITASNLAFLLYRLPDAEKYNAFCMSKKNGGTRTILAPDNRLKLVQRKLNKILSVSYETISENRPVAAHGFRPGFTTITNANRHRQKRWVFNTDLEDFFPSINFGRVRGYFISNRQFALDPTVATLVAQICCFDNQLPQGAPTSPTVSNLIAGSLDFRLSRIARRNNCSYTRYADDLTFSTNEREFPDQIAVQNAEPQGWQVTELLESIISDTGFAVNHRKTRMSYKSARQSVTGLVVNRHPNIPREDSRLRRSAIHRLMKGREITLREFCDDYADNCSTEEENAHPRPDVFKKLEGMTSYHFHIKDRRDRRKETTKFFNPNSTRLDYQRLLLLKYFSRSSRPIILTEGPSDQTYLRAFLKSDGTETDYLTRIEDGELRILPQFYQFPKNGGRILGLSGGTGNIKNFLMKYADFRSELSASVELRPLIILIDDDEGGHAVTKALNSNFNTKIDKSENRTFFKISNRLYLVKTPRIMGASSSYLEMLFPQSVRDHKIDGRSFSPENDYDSSKYYGKTTFSQHIYDNRSSLDFGDFPNLIARLQAAISDALETPPTPLPPAAAPASA